MAANRTPEQKALHREFMRFYMRAKRAADPQAASDYERQRRLRQGFTSIMQSSDRARETVRAERIIDGETFVGTVEAARIVGYSENTMRVRAAQYLAIGIVITLPNGWRFIRIPRHEGDQRPPLYWNIGGR